MVHPHDAFGVVMLRNLTEARFHIPGFLEYPSLDAQIRRFKTVSGWDYASACTMNEAHDIILSDIDREKANKLERLDEIEEWVMLMNHYCISVSSNSTIFSDIVAIIPSCR
jgi:hypothetical protein